MINRENFTLNTILNDVLKQWQCFESTVEKKIAQSSFKFLEILSHHASRVEKCIKEFCLSVRKELLFRLYTYLIYFMT